MQPVILENMGDGTFKVHPLGNLAQISSVNSILNEDVDGDGNLELIIAGNYIWHRTGNSKK